MPKHPYTQCEMAIGYTFSDVALLERALTHKSFTNENLAAPHNERLEFLGDAVLQYVTTDYLYATYPNQDEGVLSMYRSSLVKTEFLIAVGKKMSLQKYIRTSVGQARELEHERFSIVADAVEALIGAIYLDGKLEKAKEYIYTHILADAEAYLSMIPLQDPKTAFQELVQSKSNETPVYVVESESGLPHNRSFVVAVMVGNEKIVSGTGKSKQDAAQKAATKALNIYEKK